MSNTKLASQIHKTIVEFPMNVSELAMILYTDEADIREALIQLRKQGLIKIDNQGRYIPAREMTQHSSQIMAMCERLAV